MAEKTEFWFQYSGVWELHDGFMYFDCYDVGIVSDEVSKMTFERIKNHFLKLGQQNPKGIFIRDPDKSFEDGLYVIKDEESCRRTLQYVEILDASKIEIFVEDDDMPLPDTIIPRELSILVGGSDDRVGDGLHNREIEENMNSQKEGAEETVRVEEILSLESEENVNLQNEGAEETVRVEEIVNLESEMREEGTVENTLNGDENPTQCSVVNRIESDYVNPMGYISEDEKEEEEEEEEEGDSESVDEEDEDSEDNNGEDNSEDIGNEVENVLDAKGYFKLGMTFADVKEARQAIHDYAVKFGYKLKFLKNDLVRIRVKCVNDSKCPFLLFISKDGENGGLAVKTVVMEHSCFR